jgi:hypothetical protein
MSRGKMIDINQVDSSYTAALWKGTVKHITGRNDNQPARPETSDDTDEDRT